MRQVQPATFLRLPLAFLLLSVCPDVAGNGLSQPAPERRTVHTADGKPLGQLRLVDPMPCFELHYEAAYRLEDLSKPLGSAMLQKPSEAYACTGFSAHMPDGQTLFGRNFDWQPNPMLVLQTRPANGYASLSTVDLSYLGYTAARSPLAAPERLRDAWRIPFDGMNEKGLAVGMMAVDHAEGPTGTGKPKVGELGILRILLDRATNVSEALALMQAHEIALGDPPIHYFLVDRTGAAAVVEFTAGRMHVFRPEGTWLAATNFTLAEVPATARPQACWRYAAVSARLEKTKGRLSAGDAMGLLKSVAMAHTRWSAIYELGTGRLTLALVRRFDRTYQWRLGE